MNINNSCRKILDIFQHMHIALFATLVCLALTACGGGENSLESAAYESAASAREKPAQVGVVSSKDGSHNIAFYGVASQSSTIGGADASRAIDGNTSGHNGDNSFAHTNGEYYPWWRVDFTSAQMVTKVSLWNRTDCCGERLSNFTVYLLDKNQAIIASRYVDTVGVNRDIDIAGYGVYAVKIQLQGANFLTLAEVQVFGYSNVAAGKPAFQSSTLSGDGGDASRATDGIRGGGGFVATHTLYEAVPSLYIDLGEPHLVSKVVLWNRSDCCKERLRDVVVTYYDEDGIAIAAQDFAGGDSSLEVVEVPLSATGVRYVMVEQFAEGYLHLDEVEVYGVNNIARGKPTRQSSTVLGGVSSKAVDGNIDGDYSNGSVTHTDYGNSWWEVNLGAPQDISSVRLWNRTDCCADRLRNFFVDYLDSNGALIKRTDIAENTNAKIDIPMVGVGVSRVRVQLQVGDYLSLAEVQVFPALNLEPDQPAPPPPPPSYDFCDYFYYAYGYRSENCP